MRFAPRLSCFFTLILGALIGWFAFAPIGAWWLAPIGFAALALMLRQASSVKRGAWLGWLFGLGYFVGGVAWVRVSLYEFGGMPLPMAWFAAILFCAVLALYFMLASAFITWARSRHLFLFAASFAAALSFADYLRGHLFTGFEWLSVGSVMPPALTGFVPIFGLIGQGFLLLFISALLAVSCFSQDSQDKLRALPRVAIIGAALSAFLGSVLFSKIDYSEPIGAPLKVSLVQGNIAQSVKWDPDAFISTLKTYDRLTQSAAGSLIILPETALPTLISRVPPDYLAQLAATAKSKSANIVFGTVTENKGGYFNAALSTGIEPSAEYRKIHLVPFGEYMPLRSLLSVFYAQLTIPMSDMLAGAPEQTLMKLNGQQLGVSICYEDSFARDVHRSLPDATLLVNMSNDAWFGQSHAAEQHLQLAALRALEFARPMLRANNTGVTAAIDHHGRIDARLESFTTGVLETTVQGRKGSTPYTAWGDLPILVLCIAAMAIAAARRWSGKPA